jgi:hypothetical protein
VPSEQDPANATGGGCAKLRTQLESRQRTAGFSPDEGHRDSACSTGQKEKWVPSEGTLCSARHENSNYILLRIPIEISNSARGEKAIAVAEGPLHCCLPLSPAAITRLQDVRLIRLPRPVRARKPPIDYSTLQQTYARMLAEGSFSTRTDLARHPGVSRVRVSRVLKGLERKAG